MIQKTEGRFVEIIILQRSHPENIDFEDGNWLEAEIRIDVPGFKGLYDSNLRTDDFARFYASLEKLRTYQSREIEFSTMEEGIYLKGTLSLTGKIKWDGTAKLSYGNSRLAFIIETNYSSIDDLLRQTQDVLDDYPVIGTFD